MLYNFISKSQNNCKSISKNLIIPSYIIINKNHLNINILGIKFFKTNILNSSFFNKYTPKISNFGVNISSTTTFNSNIPNNNKLDIKKI